MYGVELYAAVRLAVVDEGLSCPHTINNEGVIIYDFEAYRGASSPAVYASRRALPHAMQDALPAGGLRLCRAGVEPAGSLREVSAHVILLSRASPGAITVRPSRGTVRPAVRLAREAKLCIKGETDVGAAGFALLAWEDPNGADGALSPICAWGRRSTACWWRCWPPRGCRSGAEARRVRPSAQR